MIESVDIFPGSALAAAVGWDCKYEKEIRAPVHWSIENCVWLCAATAQMCCYHDINMTHATVNKHAFNKVHLWIWNITYALTIAPNRSLLLLVLLTTAGAGVEAEVKSPNSACKPSRSDEAEEGMVAAAAAGCLTLALAGAGLLPIRPSRSAEAEVEAGTLLGEGAVTGRGGSVLATAGL